MVQGWCKDGARMVQGWCKDGARKVQGRCKEGVRKVYGRCKEGVRMVQGWCKDGARKVQGRCCQDKPLSQQSTRPSTSATIQVGDAPCWDESVSKGLSLNQCLKYTVNTCPRKGTV